MLTITKSQDEAFRAREMRRFHEEMAAHVAAFAPERARVAGEEGVTAFVAAGVAAARGHGLVLRGPVRCWLEIGVVLGAGFDTDPQYRGLWPDLDPAQWPMPFAERLQANVMAFVEACMARDRSTLVRVVAAVAEHPLTPRGDTADDVVAGLAEIWPEKLAHVGEGAIRGMAAETSRRAAQSGLVSAEGRLLAGVLGVSFGAGVLSDPLYPWIHRRLAAPRPEPDRVRSTIGALRAYAREAADRYRAGT